MTPDQIRQARMSTNLSQKQFEHLTGIRISRLECGERQPTATHLKILALVQDWAVLKALLT